MLLRQPRASPFSIAEEVHENWSPEAPLSRRKVCRILSCSGDFVLTNITSRQQTNRVAFAKTHSLQKGWTVENGRRLIFLMNHPLMNTAEDLLEPTQTQESPRKHPKFGGGKNHCLGLHPVRRRVRDLQSVWQHEQPKASRDSCCPLNSNPQARANSSAGWCSFPYVSLHIKVPESEEGQGAPGLASPVTRHERY